MPALLDWITFKGNNCRIGRQRDVALVAKVLLFYNAQAIAKRRRIALLLEMVRGNADGI